MLVRCGQVAEGEIEEAQDHLVLDPEDLVPDGL